MMPNSDEKLRNSVLRGYFFYFFFFVNSDPKSLVPKIICFIKTYDSQISMYFIFFQMCNERMLFFFHEHHHLLTDPDQ